VFHGLGFNFSDFVNHDMIKSDYISPYDTYNAINDTNTSTALYNHLFGLNNIFKDNDSVVGVENDEKITGDV